MAITRLRFYFSHLVLTHTDGRTYTEPSSHHLVNADPEATATLTVALPNAPAGQRRSLTFRVGVDSAANVGLLAMLWFGRPSHQALLHHGTSPVVATLISELKLTASHQQ
ncbi:MbnP family protein [Hymenobacter artigasi]|uniref:Copper-binding protein MbnP-like domain-containing protein n=1 Tax=Hymenobacter artigasi TaxID=2719616 RepID=A0ABX1HL69_9BACT|nr:MbnP family protein [Hymenobacter artigasi]NKI91006.1 hypothetical protein [Hymenobacter artigasi]